MGGLKRGEPLINIFECKCKDNENGKSSGKKNTDVDQDPNYNDNSTSGYSDNVDVYYCKYY